MGVWINRFICIDTGLLSTGVISTVASRFAARTELVCVCSTQSLQHPGTGLLQKNGIHSHAGSSNRIEGAVDII